jgi:hypothetical protein
LKDTVSTPKFEGLPKEVPIIPKKENYPKEVSKLQKFEGLYSNGIKNDIYKVQIYPNLFPGKFL